MFLQQVKKRNPELIDTAFELHNRGIIEPDTYLLDLDFIKQNAEKLAKTASKHDISLYFITKQLGRNPLAAKAIVEAGIKKAVTVDPWEARVLYNSGVSIGNIGHLVQIPTGMIKEVLKMKPEIITIYSVEKAEEISKAAREMGIKQQVMLRILDKDGFNYEGQKGGFYKSKLKKEVEKINNLSNLKITGVTAFPCLLYNYDEERIEATPNFEAVLEAKEELEAEFGLTINQVNTPSVSCVESIPLLKEMGATHGEPGHALTGTTPAHADKQLAEKPALVYVSEISHLIDDSAYAYGGGFYERSHLKGALVGDNKDKLKNNFLQAEELPSEMIDYYNVLRAKDESASVGDTAIYSFRTQVFVTRSKVAAVEGLHSGRPVLKGIYTGQGRKIRGEVKL